MEEIYAVITGMKHNNVPTEKAIDFRTLIAPSIFPRTYSILPTAAAAGVRLLFFASDITLEGREKGGETA